MPAGGDACRGSAPHRWSDRQSPSPAASGHGSGLPRLSYSPQVFHRSPGLIDPGRVRLFPVCLNISRSTFLNRDSLPLTLISRTRTYCGMRPSMI